MTTNPTNVEYYENGQIKFKLWKINNELHNENGPATVYYYENGQIFIQSWYINGTLNNVNGPAYIWYYENGKIKSQSWRINGLLNNENGPAYICYYENSKVQFQRWYINGLSHNENGPAYIMYSKIGIIIFRDWYVNGKFLLVYEIIIQKELIEKRKKAINVISKNWLISKWNGKYREFLTQVLTVPENHDSLVGKLFPNGGYDYKKFKESLLAF
jgi:antitoxin component YwqK of YwqJK toxin-antitoxin module